MVTDNPCNCSDSYNIFICSSRMLYEMRLSVSKAKVNSITFIEVQIVLEKAISLIKLAFYINFL